mmetsp:Transcript_20357/g.24418  ORF Transcript_20357/g.24418 Transcript_20357/m.24418 type:complete len:284 (+) Transcript_20357:85-936(+)
MSFGKKSQREIDAEMRSNYSNKWNVEVFGAPTADPLYCLFAVCCAPCASYQIRSRILHGDMSRYVCCAGTMPCSGKCQEQQCPELCLALEAYCCFANSVVASRYLIQDERRVENSECDNCLISFMVLLHQLACVLHIAACLTGNDELEQLADIFSWLADMAYCSVCACMQTQHKAELDVRDGKRAPIEGGAGAGPQMHAPGPQHMQMHAHQPPPMAPPGAYPGPGGPPMAQPVHYPPPGGQYPPQQYPPPGAQQYPPPGGAYGYPPPGGPPPAGLYAQQPPQY